MKALNPFLLLTAALVLAVRPAGAEIMDYQQFVHQNASLVHHWDFEGASDAQRRQDKAGSAHLSEQGSSGWSPDYAVDGFAVPGLGASSAAVETKRSTTHREPGAGFVSPSITLGSTVHVEAVFQPTTSSLADPDYGNDVGYVVGNRVGNDRGYFLMQGGPGTGSDDLNLLVGGWSTSDAGNILDPLIPDNWYYYSASFEYGGGGTTVNAWIADLSYPNPTLNKIVDNDFRGGKSFARSSTPLYIGANPGGFSADFFPGLIDEVAIFNTALSAGTVEANFAAIMVPEPSGIVLMLFGLGGLVLATGRRGRGK